jgi:hypothetical protein
MDEGRRRLALGDADADAGAGGCLSGADVERSLLPSKLLKACLAVLLQSSNATARSASFQTCLKSATELRTGGGPRLAADRKLSGRRRGDRTATDQAI